MADETISTRIVANADFSALIADVHKVTASLSKLQEQLANSNKMLANNVAVMNRNFSDTLRSTGQYSTHFVSLTSDVEKFGKNLDGGRLKLKDYFSTFQGHVKTSGGLIRDLARQQVAMQNAILQPLGRNSQGLQQFNVHIPRGLDEIKNKTAIAKQELQIMNRVIQDGAGQLINWGKNTQWAGRQLTVGLTLPIAAFGKAAADAFKVADQELVRLTKVYGDVAGTSAAELGRVRDEVIATSKELSAAFGTNFTETISLAADIAATGKTGNELLNSVRETSRLAVLGEVDRQEAMRATLAIQTAFKQNTDELSDSINFLNAVENQTSTTLQDLVEAIPKAGPVVKSLGGDIQDLALYLTAMREGGINASEAANALKSGLASLINPTKQSVGVMSDFGIDILGMVQKNAGNTTNLLFDLQAALDRLDPLSKAQAIEQLFGKFQFARISALLNNLGRQGSQTLQVLDLMKVSAADLEQVAGRELAAVTESASGKYRRAIESLKADLAGLGDQFLSIATTVINIVDKALKFFEGLPKPLKQAMTFLGALTALAGPLIMLTGVLANFFGYILKGVMHMKAFFKGGEGWKYLTPEMLAAEKAGKLVEQTFYSDAKAASVLQLALKNLIDEFSILEAKAKSGALAVNPAVSTMAGNLVMGAGPRVVDPNNPLVGAMGTRASTHMVPRSALSAEQRMQQTIFGLVPGAIPVNRKIGNAPQIYMNEPLPPVPGVTTVGGVSTGVVAGEAAKWHAMMATLAMQSKAEIEQLKKQIATTGVVSKDFMNQFDDILPIVSGITDKAAQQSALIVAELRAGKLTVEQARQQIIALNLEVERMIGQAVGTQAAAMGRTINPTIIPTLNQPVVDPTGKSNMRELFKKSKTRDLINKISRSLGVRTSGAGYNIETTRPRKFNSGGPVYMSSGAMVPGPNVNADVVPAMLTPGEFVVNREAAQRNLPLLMAINGGIGGGGPGFNRGGRPNTATSDFYMSGLMGLMSRSMDPDFVQAQRMRHIVHDTAGIMELADRYNIPIDQQDAVGMATDLRNSINSDMMGRPNSDLSSVTNKHVRNLEKTLQSKYGINLRYKYANRPAGPQRQYYTRAVRGVMSMRSIPSQDRQLASRIYRESRARFQGFVSEHAQPFETMTGRGTAEQFVPKHNIGHAFAGSASINQATRRLSVMGLGPDMTYMSPTEQRAAAARYSSGLGYGSPENLISRQNAIRSGFRSGPMSRFLFSVASRGRMRIGRNSGGLIPGYNSGGLVPGYNRGGKIPGVRYYNEGTTGGGVAPMRGTGMGAALGSMALFSAAPMVGGTAGSLMQGGAMALSLLQMLPFLPKVGTGFGNLSTKLKQPIGPLKGVSDGLTKTAGGFTGLMRIFGPVLRGLSGILRIFSPLGLAITAVTTAVIFGVKKWKEHVEAQRVARLEFGMTADVAKKAGYTYVDYNKKIKDAIEDAKALAERNRMIYESMTMANTPLKMTIEQYKKLREQVKETMGDYIKLFDQTDKGDIGSLATRLKAQFMAAGDSAETATAKIYALISQSNKAGSAGLTIGSQAFKAIQTLEDAAAQSIKTFEGALEASDLKGQADSLFGAFTAIDSAIADTVAKSDEAAKKGKGTALTVGEAQKQVMDKLNSQFKNQRTLTTSVINEIKKMNPELGKVLNNTDTITSAWSKYQLIVRGVNVDLSKMSGAAANAAISIISSVDSLTTSYLKTNSATKGLYSGYKDLTDKIEALKKAQQGQSAKAQIDSRKAIENLNKEIAAIRKRAEEKIKALRAANQAENDQLEIQRLQLEYQQALARGDKDAAASAQISLQQFSNDVQMRKAEESIMAKAELEIAPFQKQLDALSKKNQELADKAALAGDSLSALQAEADKLKSNIDNLNSAMSRILINRLLDPSYAGSQRERDDIAAYRKFAGDVGITGSKPKVYKNPATSPDQARERYNKDQAAKYSESDVFLNSLAKSIEKNGIVANNVNVYTKDQNKKGPKTGNAEITSFQYRGGTVSTVSQKSLKEAGHNMPSSGWLNYEFTASDGKKYKITSDSSPLGLVVSRAKYGVMGGSGMVLAGESGPEIVDFSSNSIIPIPRSDAFNLMQTLPNATPRYNIPTNTISGIGKGANNSYNNNTYNIDIELNGTNITADDIMRRFKAELALINAKEGRTRTLGGNY